MQASRFPLAIGMMQKPQGWRMSYPPRCRRATITILQRLLPIRAPIPATYEGGTRIKGMGMTEQPDNAALEREEITTRIASFKATQARFERERDEYFVTTLENARHENVRSAIERPVFWS
jgi:hypothetical protein